MDELKRYVNKMFRDQKDTAEVKELEAEILSNMQAQKMDLMAQGVSEAEAIRKVKESMPSLNGLIEDQQLTWVDRYHTDCLQSMLLSSVLFWILSLPGLMVNMSITRGAVVLGCSATVICAVVYAIQKYMKRDRTEILAVSDSRHRTKLVWMVWGTFVAVVLLSGVALCFGSNIWFHRPIYIHVDGPYQFAVMVLPIYLLLLTALIPMTVAGFTRLLKKQAKEADDENQ